MVRLLVLVSIVCAVLAGTAGAASQAFVYDRELGITARETLWHAVREEARMPRSEVRRVYVRCYLSKDSFERAFERRFGVSARRVIAYYAGGGDVHLRSQTCTNVHTFLQGRHTVLTAAAFSILIHESLHRQGIRNERIVTCFANEAVRWGASWYGFEEERALRARNLAFEFTKRYAPPSYLMGRPTCLALARQKSWPEFTTRASR
ncbi:MAG TPA: hypothetical protein VK926_08500 [Gaiellaceae bacterium]|nr:hypothetical protein [Gaiellaceae bacterium]